jgi:hypothetical protein
MTCGTLAWGLDGRIQYFNTQTRNNIDTQSRTYENPATNVVAEACRAFTPAAQS